jgi:hypothetical protein
VQRASESDQVDQTSQAKTSGRIKLEKNWLYLERVTALRDIMKAGASFFLDKSTGFEKISEVLKSGKEAVKPIS